MNAVMESLVNIGLGFRMVSNREIGVLDLP